jgi:hypothetical protein
MTLAELSLVAFAVLNGMRAVAYLPQMMRVYRDPGGAAAVSIVTWVLFAASNIATVAYALTVAGDRVVAVVFAINTACCLAIVVMTVCKRMSAGTDRWLSAGASPAASGVAAAGAPASENPRRRTAPARAATG